MLGIVEFFTKYWKQFIAIAFVLIILGEVSYLYHDNKKLTADLAVQKISMKTEVENYVQLKYATDQLNGQINDLKMRNNVLTVSVAVSQKKVSSLNSYQKKLVDQIQKATIPADCDSKIEWLRKQALGNTP